MNGALYTGLIRNHIFALTEYERFPINHGGGNKMEPLHTAPSITSTCLMRRMWRADIP